MDWSSEPGSAGLEDRPDNKDAVRATAMDKNPDDETSHSRRRVDRAEGDQAMATQCAGSRLARAAKIAQSAQSMRGRGLVRRRTATS